MPPFLIPSTTGSLKLKSLVSNAVEGNLTRSKRKFVAAFWNELVVLIDAEDLLTLITFPPKMILRDPNKIVIFLFLYVKK